MDSTDSILSQNRFEVLSTLDEYDKPPKKVRKPRKKKVTHVVMNNKKPKVSETPTHWYMDDF
jgi:hypothetical protein